MNNDFDFTSMTYSTVFADEKKKNKNGFAIASLVLGIVSLLSCCCASTAIGMLAMGICAILAIVFAFVAKKNENGKMDAKAVAGLVLGLVAIVVILCFAAAVVGIFAMIDTVPQEEMMTFLEENVKPMMEGNEASYDKIMEAVKAVYAAKGAK